MRVARAVAGSSRESGEGRGKWRIMEIREAINRARVAGEALDVCPITAPREEYRRLLAAWSAAMDNLDDARSGWTGASRAALIRSQLPCAGRECVEDGYQCSVHR